MGLVRASHGGLEGIQSGLTKSTDHPGRSPIRPLKDSLGFPRRWAN